jgi:hypothetical protein
MAALSARSPTPPSPGQVLVRASIFSDTHLKHKKPSIARGAPATARTMIPFALR